MNLHEYQSKEVFREFGIPVPRARPPRAPRKPVAAAQSLGGKLWVVKAQVHAGGRGKAGGVKLARDLDTVRSATADMLGQRLVTKQTGPEGLPIETVYVETGSKSTARLPSLTLNREKSKVAVIASAAGGMDIEEVAEHSPEKILRVDISPTAGCRLPGAQARLRPWLQGSASRAVPEDPGGAVSHLHRARRGAARSESADRHQERRTGGAGRQDQHRRQRRVPAEGGGRDARSFAGRSDRAPAAEHDLNYVSLDGDIACMVNGAGLAMATMDLIKLHGGNPANFLDGGGATAERVTAAFKLILSNKKVKAILVNIFGGIVRCDLIAEGVMIAVKQGVSVPVVVRLEGTNAEQAREMLAHSALAITPATDLTDAAQKAVNLAKGKK